MKLADAHREQSSLFVRFQEDSAAMVGVLRLRAVASKHRVWVTQAAFSTWRRRSCAEQAARRRRRRREARRGRGLAYVFAMASKERAVQLNLGFRRWVGYVGALESEETRRRGTQARVAVRCLLGVSSLSGQKTRRLHGSFARWKACCRHGSMVEKTLSRIVGLGRLCRQKRAFRWWKAAGDHSHWEMVRMACEARIAIGHKRWSLDRLVKSIGVAHVSSAKYALNRYFRAWQGVAQLARCEDAYTKHAARLRCVTSEHEEALAQLTERYGATHTEQFARFQKEANARASLLRYTSALSKHRVWVTHAAFSTWRRSCAEQARRRRREARRGRGLAYVFAMASKESAVLLNMSFRRWVGYVDTLESEETQRRGTKARVAVRCLLGVSSLSGSFSLWCFSALFFSMRHLLCVCVCDFVLICCCFCFGFFWDFIPLDFLDLCV